SAPIVSSRGSSAGTSPRYTRRSVPPLMPERKVRTRTSPATGRGRGSSLISTRRGPIWNSARAGTLPILPSGQLAGLRRAAPVAYREKKSVSSWLTRSCSSSEKGNRPAPRVWHDSGGRGMRTSGHGPGLGRLLGDRLGRGSGGLRHPDHGEHRRAAGQPDRDTMVGVAAA